MSKLTKSQKQQIHESFMRRWKTILTEDDTTDGFYEDLADALGHGDVSESSPEALLYADKVLKTAVAWLMRTPAVP